jgi:hypothetical protein
MDYLKQFVIPFGGYISFLLKLMICSLNGMNILR